MGELRRKSSAFIFFVFFLIYLHQVLMSSSMQKTSSESQNIHGLPKTPLQKISNQVYFFKGERHDLNTNSKLILIWTPFFNSWSWVELIKKEMDSCQNVCNVTNDKSRIKEADVILFHIYDLIWFWVHLPKYRTPEQVWVIWTAEPPTRIWMNLRNYKNVFNWTMHYRRDSTIEAPFADVKQLSQIDQSKMRKFLELYKPFVHKTRLLEITNSDCYDQAERYRIVEDIRQHIHVDFYGRCGNLKCPRDSPDCHKKLTTYKFTFALENSYCDDYITEKYWNALSKWSIPVVNWKAPQTQYHVIPKSYINVFDFRTMKEAAEYIAMVAHNETLYKTYHDWRTTYSITSYGVWWPFRKLCSAIHDTNRPAQVITDLNNWIEEDSCAKGVPWSFLDRRFKRHMFDLGF